ncbi:hypothetical protein [Flavobacterium aestivum]|uniref:hypothetical protein n=1 Tax=Flavobacterium aestivum TaxID=3003257 RepID=UPI002286BDB6|nr:hypothetical protein [Flavobacterium aestivum]
MKTTNNTALLSKKALVQAVNCFWSKNVSNTKPISKTSFCARSDTIVYLMVLQV